MVSELALFGNVETSMFQGLAAVKSPPSVVVVDPLAVVVVELLDVVDDAVVVVVVVVIEVVVGGRVVEVVAVVVELVAVVAVVDVVERRVVVVVDFFRLALTPRPQVHSTHSSSTGQSAALSHCSPAAVSSQPSPQTDAVAVNRRRFVPFAENAPTSVVQVASATFAVSRTSRSVPHAAHRARTVLVWRWLVTRAGVAGHPLTTVTSPAASITMAPKGSGSPATNGGATRKRTPGQGGDAVVLAVASAVTSVRARSSPSPARIVEVSTAPFRKCLACVSLDGWAIGAGTCACGIRCKRRAGRGASHPVSHAGPLSGSRMPCRSMRRQSVTREMPSAAAAR